MRGFLLDSNGDVVIENNKIVMIDGQNLKAQTVRTLLGTNKGEWFGNEEEGISFKNILGKNRMTVQTTNYTQQSGDLTEAQELALAQKLRNRLDGDI